MISLISRVDTSHRDMIHDAQMDYFGTRLATCSSDKSIKIFDVRPDGHYVFLADLVGHEGPVWQVTWSHPMYGNLIASCSYDRKVIIWKESGGRWNKQYQYANHDASVNSVQWAPPEYGLMLAAASSDGSVSFLYSPTGETWESKKVQNAHSIGCNCISWCPSQSPGSILDASTKSEPEHKRMVTGGCDNLVKIWREENDQWILEHKLEGHKDWVRDVSWAPCFGLKQSTIASCSQDQRVLIWRSSNLEGPWQSTQLCAFDDVVWHVSWSLCGSILAVSGGDNKISLWKENSRNEWNCISDSQKSRN